MTLNEYWYNKTPCQEKDVLDESSQTNMKELSSARAALSNSPVTADWDGAGVEGKVLARSQERERNRYRRLEKRAEREVVVGVGGGGAQINTYEREVVVAFVSSLDTLALQENCSVPGKWDPAMQEDLLR